MSKRFYGLFGTDRLSHRTRLQGLYTIAQRQVAHEWPDTLVIAVGRR